MSDENMRMMCEHEKEYIEGVVLLSYPSKKEWVCKKCRVKGYKIEKQDSNFNKIKREFEKRQTH